MVSGKKVGERAARLARVERLGRTAGWIAIGGIVATVGYAAYLAWDRDAFVAYALGGLRDAATIAVAPGSIMPAYLLSLIPIGLFAYALWLARGLFALFARGRVIDAAVPAVLRRMGLVAIAAPISAFLARTIGILILTKADGGAHLAFGIGSDQIAALVVGLLLLAFAEIVRETLRLDEENQSFV